MSERKKLFRGRYAAHTHQGMIFCVIRSYIKSKCHKEAPFYSATFINGMRSEGLEYLGTLFNGFMHESLCAHEIHSR